MPGDLLGYIFRPLESQQVLHICNTTEVLLKFSMYGIYTDVTGKLIVFNNWINI
jgi:hypothetical protein